MNLSDFMHEIIIEIGSLCFLSFHNVSCIFATFSCEKKAINGLRTLIGPQKIFTQ